MTQLEARRISYLVVSLGTTGWRFESSPVHQTSSVVPFLPLIKQDCCPHGVHTAEDRLESGNPEDLRISRHHPRLPRIPQTLSKPRSENTLSAPLSAPSSMLNSQA